jgi:hypothetical protein
MIICVYVPSCVVVLFVCPVRSSAIFVLYVVAPMCHGTMFSGNIPTVSLWFLALSVCVASIPRGYLFLECVSFYIRCRIPDSYVAVYHVLFYTTLSSATAISFIVISVFRCNAPLVRAIKLLSMRASAQVSSDLVVLCPKGDKFLLHGVGGRQWTRLSGSCSIVWHRLCYRPAVS